MKTHWSLHVSLLGRMNATISCQVISGLSGAALMLVGGCASHQPAGITAGPTPPLSDPIRFQLGTIALGGTTEPAQVGFDKADGRIETFGNRASAAAAKMLDPSGLTGDAGAQAVLSAPALVAAPVAALVAGLSSSDKLTPVKLSNCESNLLYEMIAMSAQENFRNWVLRTADGATRRRLIPMDSTIPALGSLAETLLETQVLEVRLERTGKSDSSYALRIKALARLSRTADGKVLDERPIEYISGTCLFNDWTMADSVRHVAGTAYRTMAESLVNQLFLATPEGPLLAGGGFPKSPNRQLALHPPTTQFVSYSAGNPGSIGIYSTTSDSPLALQRPMTKDQGVSQAIKDTEWRLDGLYNNPNLIISLAAMVPAIPMSLWGQGAAMVGGLTERQAKAADVQMAAAVRNLRLHQEVARQVAQQLEPRTSQWVVLVNGPFGPHATDAYARQGFAPGKNDSGLPKERLATSSPAEKDSDTALVIEVETAALAGKAGLNPPLALCIEANARLLRARDGQEIYSCPIRYRSSERNYTEWAAHDAQLFRQELQSCYRELGASITDQLVTRGLVAPDAALSPLVAEK